MSLGRFAAACSALAFAPARGRTVSAGWRPGERRSVPGLDPMRSLAAQNRLDCALRRKVGRERSNWGQPYAQVFDLKHLKNPTLWESERPCCIAACCPMARLEIGRQTTRRLVTLVTSACVSKPNRQGRSASMRRARSGGRTSVGGEATNCLKRSAVKAMARLRRPYPAASWQCGQLRQPPICHLAGPAGWA